VILTGSKIRQAIADGEIQISPFAADQLNPNSYDLRLSPHVLEYTDDVLDAAKESAIDRYTIGPEGLLLEPGRLYIMSTIESTGTRCYVPGIEGRSSVGRLGISVHATAGFGDVGFDGTWTLEVSVVKPVWVYPKMRICQVYFMHCTVDPLEDLYVGKYLNQTLPRPTRIWTERSEWAVE
jgi:dCTP deaminase